MRTQRPPSLSSIPAETRASRQVSDAGAAARPDNGLAARRPAAWMVANVKGRQAGAGAADAPAGCSCFPPKLFPPHLLQAACDDIIIVRQGAPPTDSSVFFPLQVVTVAVLVLKNAPGHECTSRRLKEGVLVDVCILSAGKQRRRARSSHPPPSLAGRRTPHQLLKAAFLPPLVVQVEKSLFCIHARLVTVHVGPAVSAVMTTRPSMSTRARVDALELRGYSQANASALISRAALFSKRWTRERSAEDGCIRNGIKMTAAETRRYLLRRSFSNESRKIDRAFLICSF